MALAKEMSNKLDEQAYLSGEIKSEIRHELIDGHTYAMAGGSENHNILAGNIFSELKSSLKQNTSPCKIFMSDMKLKVELNNNNYYYPDIMVVCEKADNENDYYKKQPVMIVEVLSKSTEKFDKSGKRLAYLTLPSLEEYVLIEQDKCEVTVFDKNNGWQPSYYYLGDNISFNSLNVTLSVEDIYYQIENQDMLSFIQSKDE